MIVFEKVVRDLSFKFLIEDFVGIPDEVFVETFNRMKLNLLEERGFDPELIQLLYTAKNRRHPDYFNGVVACGLYRLFEICDEISCTPGLRKQIHFYHKPHTHALGFDIKNINGKLSIVAVDSVRMAMLMQVIEKIIEHLETRSITFQIVACQSKIESDSHNCQPFTYILLTQLAKVRNIHEDLEKVPGIAQPQFYDSASGSMIEYHKQVTGIKWIENHNLPEKLMFATQSYVIISRILVARNEPVSQEYTERGKKLKEKVLPLLANHPKGSNVPLPKNDYIEHRRTRIASFFTEKLCKSVMIYRQQLTQDLKNLIDLVANKPNDHLYTDLKQFFNSLSMPIKYKLDILGELANYMLTTPEKIYKNMSQYHYKYWCLELVEDLFTLRKLIQYIITENKIPMQTLNKHHLIDMSLPELLDFKVEGDINCFRYDLTTGSTLVATNYSLWKNLLEKYGAECIYDLTRKPLWNFPSGTVYYIQAIAQLSADDLEEFMQRYPDAVAIQNNFDELHSYLGLKIHDDDQITIAPDYSDNENDSADLVEWLTPEANNLSPYILEFYHPYNASIDGIENAALKP